MIHLARFGPDLQPATAWKYNSHIWRPVYWALTSLDQGLVTILLALKIGRAAWSDTLNPRANRRAERIYRALRFAFYITTISGIVPSCFAFILAFLVNFYQHKPADQTVFLRCLVLLYSWLNLVATQVAYLATVIKSIELQQEEPSVAPAPNADWICDLEKAGDHMSRRGHHRDATGHLRRESRRIGSKDAHGGLSSVREQPENETSYVPDRTRHHWFKVKSLIDNLGLVYSHPNRSHPGTDDRQSGEPAYVTDHESSTPRFPCRPSIVATIGCPMDLEAKTDFWSYPISEGKGINHQVGSAPAR